MTKEELHTAVVAALDTHVGVGEGTPYVLLYCLTPEDNSMVGVLTNQTTENANDIMRKTADGELVRMQ